MKESFLPSLFGEKRWVSRDANNQDQLSPLLNHFRLNIHYCQVQLQRKWLLKAVMQLIVTARQLRFCCGSMRMYQLRCWSCTLLPKQIEVSFETKRWMRQEKPSPSQNQINASVIIHCAHVIRCVLWGGRKRICNIWIIQTHRWLPRIIYCAISVQLHGSIAQMEVSGPACKSKVETLWPVRNQVQHIRPDRLP